MIPRLLFLVSLALGACAADPSFRSENAMASSADAWRPDLPPDRGPILREDLPPPPNARTDDPIFATSDTDNAPSTAGSDLLPAPAVSASEESDPTETTEAASDPAPWTPIVFLPGTPERRLATLPARTEIGADCAGQVPPAALPFATPWMEIAHGRIAAVAEGEGAPMLYLRDPDGDWHCGLQRAEAPARPGRWQLHVGTLRETAPIPPVRVRLEHASP
jgi:hypothetical protein